MNSNARYAVAGLFIIILTVAMIGLIMWMTLGTEDRKTNRYIIYMNESVAGLSEQAPVKMRGVDIGKVASVQLDPDNPWRVEVLVDIYEDTPIVVGTRAQLIVSAITSVGYIELSGGSLAASELSADEGEEYPEIPTRPSLPSRLEGVFTTLTDRIEVLTRRITSVLSVQNVNNVTSIIADFEQITHDLAREDGPLQKGLNGFASIGDLVDNSQGEIDQLLSNVNYITSNMATITTTIANAESDIAKTMQGLGTMGETISQNQDRLNNIIASAEKTSRNIEALSEDLIAEDGALQSALTNISEISNALGEGEKNAISSILNDAETVTQNLNQFSQNLANLSGKMDNSLELLDDALVTVNQSSKSIGVLADSGNSVVNRFGQQLLPSLQGTLNELDRLSEDGQILLQQLQSNPERIIFGGNPRPAGPGE